MLSRNTPPTLRGGRFLNGTGTSRRRTGRRPPPPPPPLVGHTAQPTGRSGRRLTPLPLPDTADWAGSAAASSSTALMAIPERAVGTSVSPALPHEEMRVVIAGPSPRPLVTVEETDMSRVCSWPLKPQKGKQKQLMAKNSKAPLALQLEAFLRKEHRQYLLENPDCSRADTLHIFREAFTVLVDHFTEYKSVLSLIRDEYDAALDEMTEQTQRMRVADLENKSDRSLHAMELMQLKESLNATISNQQAQLKATQGLLHALREQLAAAEHANSLLQYEMERRLREHDDAKEQVKLLATAMVEESARTAMVMEDSRKKEKEMELMNARLKVMKENILELEDCLRVETERKWRFSNDAGNGRAPSTNDRTKAADPGPAPGTGAFTDEYVHQLLSKVDTLEFALATARGEGKATAKAAAGGGDEMTNDEEQSHATSSGEAARLSFPMCRHVGRAAEEALPVLREWLRQEGITEADVEDTDYLLPPGNWPTEELAFLKACLPVPNRHLTLSNTLLMLEEFWSAREQSMDHSRLPEYFLSWLSARTGGGAAAKELGVNLLQSCQRNLHHPECRAILLLLRGFLPEQLVLTWRQQLRSLRAHFENTASAATESSSAVPVEEFFHQVRSTWPGKPRSNFLQLRFWVSRRDVEKRGVVDCDALLAPDSPFVALLKSQMMREVEEFTLRVVEGVRAAGDSAKNTVSVAKVLEVIRGLDSGTRNEVLYGVVAEATQKPLIEAASADAGAVILVRLDTLLARFRGTVLLTRSTLAE